MYAFAMFDVYIPQAILLLSIVCKQSKDLFLKEDIKKYPSNCSILTDLILQYDLGYLIKLWIMSWGVDALVHEN